MSAPENLGGVPPVEEHEGGAQDITLTHEDAPWLETLRGTSIDEEWLSLANRLVESGSMDVRGNIDTAKKHEVMEARRLFYGVALGWETEEHSFYSVYQHFFINPKRAAPPPSTVIRAQRYLSGQPVHMSRLLTHPPLLALSRESLKTKFDTLEDRGIDISRTTARMPHILGFSAETIGDRIDTLHKLGINAVAAINQDSNILRVPPEVSEEKINELADLGLDIPKVVSKMPFILGNPVKDTKERIDALSGLGIDAIAVVNKMPSLIGSSLSTIERKLRRVVYLGHLLGWQEDPIEFVNTAPVILTYSSKKLSVHARLFAEHGQPDISINQARSMMIMPLEYHLLTLVETNSYTASGLQSTYKRFRGHEPKAHLTQLLLDLTNRQEVGEKVIRAYSHYVGGKRKSPAQPA